MFCRSKNLKISISFYFENDTTNNYSEVFPGWLFNLHLNSKMLEEAVLANILQIFPTGK